MVNRLKPCGGGAPKEAPDNWVSMFRGFRKAERPGHTRRFRRTLQFLTCINFRALEVTTMRLLAFCRISCFLYFAL